MFLYLSYDDNSPRLNMIISCGFLSGHVHIFLVLCSGLFSRHELPGEMINIWMLSECFNNIFNKTNDMFKWNRNHFPLLRVASSYHYPIHTI